MRSAIGLLGTDLSSRRFPLSEINESLMLDVQEELEEEKEDDKES